MKVIATHINADFDGFAAMIGLLKLHPDARLFFPGSKEPGLREFLKEIRKTGTDYPEISLKDIHDLSHLILVDVGREDRLGSLATILKSSNPLIEIYDHHPQEQVTIRADRVHVRPYGSTTAIVVHELMQAGVSQLSSLEASVLLTGIYEDTANFLSTGTTKEDFDAALYLMEHGAELSIVNRLLTHRLQPDQVTFFNSMVSHCETVNIEGIPVVLSSFSWKEFVPEAAYLVHRLMDLEPIDVFFALILMEGRVHVIARSLIPDADVGQMMTQLGGGGHKMAASAVLKGVTLIEAREKLMGVLLQNLKRRQTAADMMKCNIIQVAPAQKLSVAAERMNSFRINTLVVNDGEKVVGTISRQIVDGAIFHGLSDRPVQDYMATELPLIDPETPLDHVLDQMVSGRHRFILVGNDPEHVEGIITRMDLLRLHYELRSPLSLRRGKRAENLRAMLKKRLPGNVFRLLEDAGIIAEKVGSKVFLVGGMVRDLLLHRENMDVDLVVEGDGIRFAEEFASFYSCQVATHKRFGTARLSLPDRFKVDVATARTESYHAPAALPHVLGGILRQDLYRRDFTINTLAVDLSPKHFGQLIDYFGGWDDLHQGVIRVLHSLSFIDDPTRTLRAIRFATRFNFQISKDTKRLIHSAVESKVLEKLSGKRLWTELRNVLQEEHPIPAMRLMHQYKLLAFVYPELTLDAFLLDLFYQVQTVLSWFYLNFLRERPRNWLLYLMALLEKLDKNERVAIAKRFQLTSDVQEILRSYKTNTKDIRARLMMQDNKKAASLYFSLREYPLEVLLYAMARSSEEGIRQQIATYLRELRHVRLAISGDDLLRMGLQQGPKVKEALDRVLRARLDGEASGRDQQLKFAADVVEEMGSGVN